MSTLRVTNVAPLSGTSTDFMEGLTKAWCSWDMAGGTVNTINYTNNASTAAGKCATASGNNNSNGTDNVGEAATKVYRPRTTECRVYTTNTDPHFQCFKMIGDLA